MAKAHPFTLRLYRLCVVLHVSILLYSVVRFSGQHLLLAFLFYFFVVCFMFPEMMAFLPQSLFFWFLPDKLSNDA